MRPIAQYVGDMTAVVDRDEYAARALKNQAELLARKPDAGRVNNRLHFIDVVDDHAQKQRFVTIMQRVERNVFFEIVRQPAQRLQKARYLLFLRGDQRRQQSAQAERITLLLRKRRSFVQ